MAVRRMRVDLNDEEAHAAWNTAAEELRVMVSDAMACGHRVQSGNLSLGLGGHVNVMIQFAVGKVVRAAYEVTA